MKATSFATRQDLGHFARAITKGLTVKQALEVGDNGVGAWGDSTWHVTGSPVCALPKSIARRFGLFKVRLPSHNKEVVCSCLDVSPEGIVDLNPAALLALGFDPDEDIAIDGAEVTGL